MTIIEAVIEANVDASTADYSNEGNNYNATPESTVSDFGSTSSDGSFDPPTEVSIKNVSDGVGVAVAVAKAGSSNNSVTPSASGTGSHQKFSQSSGTDIIGTLLKTVSGTAAAIKAGSNPPIKGIGGLVTQKESAVKRDYAGQLGGNNVAPGSSSSKNSMLYIGAALIGVGLILHFAKGSK